MLAIVAGILVARHLKSVEDLHEWRSTPKTESLVASAVNWAERIMRKIDSTFGKQVLDVSRRPGFFGIALVVSEAHGDGGDSTYNLGISGITYLPHLLSGPRIRQQN